MKTPLIESIAVIGLGYVGLPLALAFARKGINVTGIDIDFHKISNLIEGKSYIEGIGDDEISRNMKYLKLTTDHSYIAETEAVIICVQTPLSKTRDPDISYILESAKIVSKYVKTGTLVVLESTTYPGTTEEILAPLFEEKGFKIGKDIFLAYSPERLDAGNEKYTVNNIPKVLSGVTKDCTEMAVNLYKIICEELYTVSSPRVAELTKLLENTFRSVNIALINEFTQLCNRIRIDIWEVVEAASTKPFGFMSFYPGPGIGGHCLPVDPILLSWKAKLYNFRTRLIDLSDDINRKMPEYVLYRLFQVLNDRRKSIKESKILILGVSYKENIGDIRESPALEIIKLILENGGDVIYNDPFVHEFYNDGKLLKSVKISEKLLKECDITLIINKHSTYDWIKVIQSANCILDCKNATRGILSDKIYRL